MCWSLKDLTAVVHSLRIHYNQISLKFGIKIPHSHASVRSSADVQEMLLKVSTAHSVSLDPMK